MKLSSYNLYVRDYEKNLFAGTAPAYRTVTDQHYLRSSSDVITLSRQARQAAHTVVEFTDSADKGHTATDRKNPSPFKGETFDVPQEQPEDQKEQIRKKGHDSTLEYNGPQEANTSEPGQASNNPQPSDSETSEFDFRTSFINPEEGQSFTVSRGKAFDTYRKASTPPPASRIDLFV